MSSFSGCEIRLSAAAGDGGSFAVGQGREVSDADVADEVPVGGAGKGVDILRL